MENKYIFELTQSFNTKTKGYETKKTMNNIFCIFLWNGRKSSGFMDDKEGYRSRGGPFKELFVHLVNEKKNGLWRILANKQLVNQVHTNLNQTSN